MEGLDSSREERDGGVPRRPGGLPHQINAGPRVRENYVALTVRERSREQFSPRSVRHSAEVFSRLVDGQATKLPNGKPRSNFAPGLLCGCSEGREERSGAHEPRM